MHCKNCNKFLITRSQLVYCSNICQQDFKYKEYIKNWKSGREDGNKGINARNISGHLKKYLIKKHGEKCVSCGWNKKHPNSGRVPLEVDHIDGNSENNSEKNLRLLCPNCHSLTGNFKNYNKGKGRTWRMKKYLKN